MQLIRCMLSNVNYYMLLTGTPTTAQNVALSSSLVKCFPNRSLCGTNDPYYLTLFKK